MRFIKKSGNTKGFLLLYNVLQYNCSKSHQNKNNKSSWIFFIQKEIFQVCLDSNYQMLVIFQTRLE